jgi:hypothetical protein
MSLIDHDAARELAHDIRMRHWLNTATAVYDPHDLGEGIRVYREGELERTIPLPEEWADTGLPADVETLGIMVPGVGWIAAVPLPGFAVPQVDVPPTL